MPRLARSPSPTGCTVVRSRGSPSDRKRLAIAAISVSGTECPAPEPPIKSVSPLATSCAASSDVTTRGAMAVTPPTRDRVAGRRRKMPSNPADHSGRAPSRSASPATLAAKYLVSYMSNPRDASIHRQHALRLEDVPNAGGILVKPCRQLVQSPRPRQIDVDDLDDPSRPRAHHHHPVGEQHCFRDAVGDMQCGLAGFHPQPL